MEITPARALGGAGLPVCLVLEPKPAALRVVALTVLDRLMVTFHRAGASRIVVVTGGEELPDIRRARALGIPFEVVETMPAMDGRVVLSGTGWWGPREEVEQGMSGATGRWTSDDGEPLGAGVLEGGSPGGLRGLEAMPGIRIGRRSSRVRDAAEARRAEDRLWSGLSSGADGMVDRWFNRPVGRWALSRWLVSTGVSPNHVSLAATAMGAGCGGVVWCAGDGACDGGVGVVPGVGRGGLRGRGHCEGGVQGVAAGEVDRPCGGPGGARGGVCRDRDGAVGGEAWVRGMGVGWACGMGCAGIVWGGAQGDAATGDGERVDEAVDRRRHEP